MNLLNELPFAVFPIVFFVFFSLIAYVKIAILLQVLRRGIGGGMPPLIVTVMLGLTLSTLTMSPVFRRSMTALSDAQIQQNQQAQQARQTQPASATPWQMGLPRQRPHSHLFLRPQQDPRPQPLRLHE